MPDTQTVINNVLALATRMGTECKTLHGETSTNTTAISTLRSDMATAIETAKSAVKTEILGGANEAYDTLKEIEDFLKANDNVLAALQALKTVRYDSQTLEIAEKVQARANIGAADADDVVTLSAQTLTDPQKAQVLTNLGAAAAADVTGLGDGVVRHDQAQTLAAANQSQARTNIGAASAADLADLQDAIGDLTNIDFVSAFETALNAGA